MCLRAGRHIWVQRFRHTKLTVSEGKHIQISTQVHPHTKHSGTAILMCKRAGTQVQTFMQTKSNLPKGKHLHIHMQPTLRGHYSKQTSPRPTNASRLPRKDGSTRWHNLKVNGGSTRWAGMASAQLYWGRMAALLLRLCYLLFPHNS